MTWKNGLTVLALVLAGVGMAAAPLAADARRLGGGRPAGMQRQITPKPYRAPANSPNTPAQPGQQQPNYGTAPPPAPAQAPAPARRSWLGPLAGVAAGLGIAALASHFGMGQALGEFLTLALIVMLGLAAIGWIARRLKAPAQPSSGAALAGAGAPYGGASMGASSTGGMYEGQGLSVQQGQGLGRGELASSSLPGAASAGAPGLADVAMALPSGFDLAGFLRVAKMIFIRLQAANDAGNVEDLRKFTTPELFASLRLDLQERGQTPNQTDVMQLDAELVDTAQEEGQWIASVRFHGLIREEVHEGAHPFNELWHLVRPLDESRDWAIAGITPLDASGNAA